MSCQLIADWNRACWSFPSSVCVGVEKEKKKFELYLNNKVACFGLVLTAVVKVEVKIILQYVWVCEVPVYSKLKANCLSGRCLRSAGMTSSFFFLIISCWLHLKTLLWVARASVCVCIPQTPQLWDQTDRLWQSMQSLIRILMRKPHTIAKVCVSISMHTVCL